jgi:hypothetical protein
MNWTIKLDGATGPPLARIGYTLLRYHPVEPGGVITWVIGNGLCTLCRLMLADALSSLKYKWKGTIREEENENLDQSNLGCPFMMAQSGILHENNGT